VNILLRALSGVYQAGIWVDRKRTDVVSFKKPIMSVGNIAFGGRSKTPFVIYLAKGFRERGFEPVVLTRGYGREKTDDLELIPSRLEMSEFQSTNKIDVRETGDEPLEIFLQADIPVLISAHRTTMLQKFLKKAPPLRWLFILDDGFQHWKLARDFDLVLVKRKDLGDHPWPEGSLRESVKSLERADMTLEENKDFTKSTQLCAHPPSDEILGVLTTRAGAQNKYFEFFTEQFPRVQCVALPDHCSISKMKATMSKSKITHWALGMKEAVKVLNWQELKIFMSDSIVRPRQGYFEGMSFYRVHAEIKVRDEGALWSKILDRVKVSEALS